MNNTSCTVNVKVIFLLYSSGAAFGYTMQFGSKIQANFHHNFSFTKETMLLTALREQVTSCVSVIGME